MGIVGTGLTLGVVLAFAILAAIEAGVRFGKKKRAVDPEKFLSGTAAVEGSLFGLLGLLLAFTFSGAMSRFDDRRTLIGREASALSKAWQRSQLLPQPQRDVAQPLLRQYTDARIAGFAALPDRELADPHFGRARALHEQLRGAAGDSPFFESLEDLSELALTRELATHTHPPVVIYVMLFLLCVVSAFFIGFTMADGQDPKQFHRIAYAVMLSVVFYLILDMEFPRQGLIRVQEFDQMILTVRAAMN